MKTSYIIGLVIVVIVIGGGAWYLSSMHMAAAPVPVVQPVGTVPAAGTNSAPTSAQGTAAPAASAPAVSAAALPARSFIVNGNDATADLKTITVAAGTPVTIVFGADAGTTYHGGLDFRSSVVNTGTIAPGSTKSVSFTATKSFSFTPYWPATNIAKPYTINVVVQ